MPWSWVRVSRATSPKLRDCVAGDPSAVRFAECVRTIVAADGGENTDVQFEPNGRWARVHFYWEDPDVKSAVVYDLQAQDVIDLISADAIETLRLRDDGAV
jgi:hypothetical protein